MDRKEQVEKLVAKISSDPDLAEELKANPRAVLVRETGISTEDWEQPLDDAELAEVTGAGHGSFKIGDPVFKYNCSCGYKTSFVDLWYVHKLSDCTISI